MTQLTLLQVDLAPPPIDEWKNLTGKNVLGSVKLEGETDNISLHWPVPMSPTPKRLHIIVELPSGKRCVHQVGIILLTVS